MEDGRHGRRTSGRVSAWAARGRCGSGDGCAATCGRRCSRSAPGTRLRLFAPVLHVGALGGPEVTYAAGDAPDLGLRAEIAAALVSRALEVVSVDSGSGGLADPGGTAGAARPRPGLAAAAASGVRRGRAGAALRRGGHQARAGTTRSSTRRWSGTGCGSGRAERPGSARSQVCTGSLVCIALAVLVEGAAQRLEPAPVAVACSGVEAGRRTTPRRWCRRCSAAR